MRFSILFFSSDSGDSDPYRLMIAASRCVLRLIRYRPDDFRLSPVVAARDLIMGRFLFCLCQLRSSTIIFWGTS